MTVAEPIVRPVIIPVALPMVAIAGLLVLQVPPVVSTVIVLGIPTHRLGPPEMVIALTRKELAKASTNKSAFFMKVVLNFYLKNGYMSKV